MTVVPFEGLEFDWVTREGGRVAVGVDEVVLYLDGNIKHISRYVKRVYPDYKFQWSGGVSGRPKWYVYEPGVYQLIFSSSLATISPEKVERFQRWVFEEVLPAIRKEGAYISPDINKEQAATAKQQLDRILDTPDPWQRFYSKEFCDRFFSWFGSLGYWDFCYSFLSAEERCKLDKLNPPVNGRREDMIHQYISKEAKASIEPRVGELTTLVLACPSKAQFLTLWANLHGKCWQLELNLVN